MKTKGFDCVEMKHRGAEEVMKKLHGLSKEQEAIFWKERSQYLKERQKAIKDRRQPDHVAG